MWGKSHLSRSRTGNLLFRVKQRSRHCYGAARRRLLALRCHRPARLAIAAVADDVIKLVKDRRAQSRPPTIRSLLRLPVILRPLVYRFLSCCLRIRTKIKFPRAALWRCLAMSEERNALILSQPTMLRLRRHRAIKFI